MIILYLTLAIIIIFIIYLIVASYLRNSGINIINIVFFGIIGFCLFILIGLNINKKETDLTIIALNWLSYTILVITMINVFLLGYFWSVIRTKTGPPGIRGPMGEQGSQGVKGSCSFNTSQSFGIQKITDYLDLLYQNFTNKPDATIRNPNNKAILINKYLNEKINSMMTSKQFEIVSQYYTEENRPLEDLYIYLQNIWKDWFFLICNYSNNGEWFLDENADEDYTFTPPTSFQSSTPNGKFTTNINTNQIENLPLNPFDEIQKYDIYHWGLAQTYRPLKYSICRNNIENSILSNRMPSKKDPRIKVISSNDYQQVYADWSSGAERDVAIWRLKTIEHDGEKYYPVGDIGSHEREHDPRYSIKKKGPTFQDKLEYSMSNNGPDRQSILVAGDIKPPVDYAKLSYAGGDQEGLFWRPIAPAGYVALGDIFQKGFKKPSMDIVRCVPATCVEEVPYKGNQKSNNPKSMGIWNQDDDWESYILSNFQPSLSPADNGYYTIRVYNTKGAFKNKGDSYKFFKLKSECLANPNVENKEVESEFAALGIGWNGTPAKQGPQYSIFKYLGFEPEGMIVHNETQLKYYIVLTPTGNLNNFFIMDSNNDTGKYTNGIQVNYNKSSNTASSTKLSISDERQQYKIIKLTNAENRNQIKLQNNYNGKFLGITKDAVTKQTIFYTTNNNSDLSTIFTFTSSFIGDLQPSI